jgi:hypothetical protein
MVMFPNCETLYGTYFDIFRCFMYWNAASVGVYYNIVSVSLQLFDDGNNSFVASVGHLLNPQGDITSMR